MDFAASRVSISPIFLNFGPKLDLVPSLDPFKSLTSMGSRFSSRHISSTRLSTAKAAIGDPGALYAADLGRLKARRNQCDVRQEVDN